MSNECNKIIPLLMAIIMIDPTDRASVGGGGAAAAFFCAAAVAATPARLEATTVGDEAC